MERGIGFIRVFVLTEVLLTKFQCITQGILCCEYEKQEGNLTLPKIMLIVVQFELKYPQGGGMLSQMTQMILSPRYKPMVYESFYLQD